jgi:PAS domain S-box-containing protein
MGSYRDSHDFPIGVSDTDVLRRIFDAHEDCIKVLDLDGRLVRVNAGGVTALELDAAADILGKYWPDLWVDDGKLEAIAAVRMALSGQPARFTGLATTGRGTPKWWDVQVSPMANEVGAAAAVLVVSRDITVQHTLAEEKAAQQQLMLDELNHRVKNTLAVVQGIVSQTLRTATSPEAARNDVMKRLTILSRAQDMLTGSSWTGAPIDDVVAAATAALSPGHNRIRTGGPNVTLGPRAVLSLSMALHELGTNATKYGALSNDDGSVDVAWTVEDEIFSLTWHETGGPPVTPPTRQGFGSRLIAGGLARGLGGETSLTFDPVGVVWFVRAPLAALDPA